MYRVEDNDDRGDLVDVRYFCSDHCLLAAGVHTDGEGVIPIASVDEHDSDVLCHQCTTHLYWGMETRQGLITWLETIRDEAKLLYDEDTERSEFDDPPSIDVRVQYHQGGMTFHSGLSDYDSDHRGDWGASSVDGGMDERDLANLADDLLEEVAESYNGNIDYEVEAFDEDANAQGEYDGPSGDPPAGIRMEESPSYRSAMRDAGRGHLLR